MVFIERKLQFLGKNDGEVGIGDFYFYKSIKGRTVSPSGNSLFYSVGPCAQHGAAPPFSYQI